MGVVEYFHKKFNDFKLTVTNPKDAARKLSKNADIGTGARTLVLFMFLAGLFGVIFSIIGTILSSLVNLAFGGTFNGFINSIIASVIMFVGYFLAFIPGFILYLVMMFTAVAFLWGIAKLLGGKSTYSKQFGVLVEPIVAITLLSTVVMGISQILVGLISPMSAIAGDAISWIFGFGSGLLGIYLIYLQMIFTAEVNEFELWKGAVSVLLPLFLVALFIVVVVVILVALLGAVALGSLGLAL